MIAESYISSMREFRITGSDDEWFHVKLTDSLLEQCSEPDAYAAIEPIVRWLVVEPMDDLLYYQIVFLLSLARCANTTETPILLSMHVEELLTRARLEGEAVERTVRDLCAWFRLPINKASKKDSLTAASS
ncbi:Uncharacterised protein [Halioglobus japonicus]|nr:Uncharacterised protein [Halioglobus japonicus]